MSNLSDLAKQAESVLFAGLEEVLGGYKEDLRPFVEEFGPIIAETALRASAGDKDAIETLALLKEMAITHEFIARRAAEDASREKVGVVIGTAIKFIFNLLV